MNAKELDRRLDAGTWGLLFVVWGVSIFFDRIPLGAGLAATGLILLGLNAVRSAVHLPASGSATIFGILALTWGGLELLRLMKPAGLPFQLNDWAVFAILLVMLGLIFLASAVRRRSKISQQEA